MQSRGFIRACCLLAVALTVSLHAQSGDAETAPARSFPISFIDNRVFVDVQIDGCGPFAFILDTGSSSVTIDNALIKPLALKPHGTGRTDGAGEHTVGYSTVHLSSVVLGDLNLGAMDVPALDGKPLARVIGFPHFDGVMGADLFMDRVVTIDVGEARLTVEDPASFAPAPSSAAVPIALNEDHMPIIDAVIDGISGRFLVDTGDRSSLTLFEPFWRAHGLDKMIGRTVTAMTGYGLGGPIRAIVGRPDAFSLGGVAVPPPVTRLSQQKAGAFATADYAGSIGMGVLTRFIVSFDYGRHIMRLTKAPKFDKPDRYDRSGAWLALGAGNRLTVLDVVDGGPAAQAGLRPGDMVRAVGDIAANPQSLFQIRTLLRQPDVPAVDVGITRDGVPVSAHIVLRDLIAPQG